MEGSPPKAGVPPRLNPQAAPFMPPKQPAKKASKKKKESAAPAKRRGQRDNFPRDSFKPVPPPPAASSAAAPRTDQTKSAERPAIEQPAIVLMLNEKKKPRSRPSAGAVQQAASAMPEMGKELVRKLESGRYECVICIAPVGKKAQVWSCPHCFVVLHLACVTTWASKSGGEAQGAWRCPHCQHVQLDEPRHVCYCGRTVRPDADPYLVVGSCGEVCERPRVGTDCPHTCNLVCHPGPCPSCPLPGPERACHCGKRIYRLKCSEVEPNGSSCEQTCGKSLACDMHRCERVCHPGSCGACPHTELQVCFCGKESADRPCGSGQRDVSKSGEGGSAMFSCAKPCDRPLACGNHRCQALCHAGPCAPCATGVAQVIACPCGKTPLAALLPAGGRSSCLDPIPACKEKCGKMMNCGHICVATCHAGPCECSLSQKITCRCGSSKHDVKCAKLFLPDAGPVLCHQSCSALRSCGKHQCNTKCCPSYKDHTDAAGMHVCRLGCNKKLKCGNHVCEEGCHKGRCPPCQLASFEEWICPCGKTVVYPPISCGQKMPNCNFPCRRGPRPCGHVDVLTHPCHPDTEPCPPCVVLVDARCACGHELRGNVRCHLARTVSCARPCGELLECGQHTCHSLCHRHQKQPNFTHGCDQRCNKSLDCQHPCTSPCHPDSQACPAQMCEKKVEIKCPCGRQSVLTACGMLHGVPAQQAEALAQRVHLECDGACTKEIRKKQLAMAFGKQHQQWQEQQILLGLARTHPVLLRRIEQNLSALITRNLGFQFDEPGAIVPNVVFPSMGSAQRKLIHLLAESFGLRSESFGDDVARSVWVTLRPMAKVPSALLSQVIADQQREAEAKGYRAADCGVLLSQLSPNIKTNHIQSMLQPWKNAWVMHWQDDHSCLIIFDEPQAARVAVNTLKGPFVATMYKESVPSAATAATSAVSAVVAAGTSPVDGGGAAAPVDAPDPFENANDNNAVEAAAGLVASPVASVDAEEWKEVK